MHRAFAYLCQGDNPKDLFGKAWSKTREFWRSLEKAWRAPLFRHRWFLPPAASDRAGSSLRGAKLRSNPGVAFVRKRRSNEAVRPAKCGLSVRKSGWPVSSKGTGPEAGAELAMTGWKLARLFLGVALVDAAWIRTRSG